MDNHSTPKPVKKGDRMTFSGFGGDLGQGKAGGGEVASPATAWWAGQAGQDFIFSLAHTPRSLAGQRENRKMPCLPCLACPRLWPSTFSPRRTVDGQQLEQEPNAAQKD